jgi:hypothetical protein
MKACNWRRNKRDEKKIIHKRNKRIKAKNLIIANPIINEP